MPTSADETGRGDGAGTGAGAGARDGAGKAGDAARIEPTLTPLAAGEFKYEQARHLLWRAGFGGTPKQIQTLAGWGPERAVDYLLDTGGIAFEEAKADRWDKDIMRPPSEEERRMYAEARRASNEDALARIRLERQNRERDDRRQIQEMQRWWLKRMIETPKPLEEKMVLFWHGHFATSYRTIENSYHMFLQGEMFRSRGLGSFAELLKGIIRDPAMLAYLDNNDSRRDRPNENLAREIMELFALGIGNYTERDIKEGARALTGYTFVDDEFQFNRRNHDTGGKTILGRSGNMDGDGFIDAILARKECAQYVTRRLYNFFCADVPPDERGGDRELPEGQRAFLRRLGDSLYADEYNIGKTLRRLLLSKHFYSPRFMGQQIKSPSVLVAGAARSLDAPARDLSILSDAMDLMGQSLYHPPSVKGWDGGRSWINTSTLFVRQNLMAYMLTGRKPQGYDATADTQRYDPMPLLEELRAADPKAAEDAGAVVDYLLRLALGRSEPTAHEALMGFMGQAGNRVTRDSVTGCLLLITAMPEYQLC
jgi:uncharacterized protein (DUF1800 family)